VPTGDLLRLVDGLRAGDPTTKAVLVSALVGTVVIVVITGVIRRFRS
jgi:hypothetical protein